MRRAPAMIALFFALTFALAHAAGNQGFAVVASSDRGRFFLDGNELHAPFVFTSDAKRLLLSAFVESAGSLRQVTNLELLALHPQAPHDTSFPSTVTSETQLIRLVLYHLKPLLKAGAPDSVLLNRAIIDFTAYPAIIDTCYAEPNGRLLVRSTSGTFYLSPALLRRPDDSRPPSPEQYVHDRAGEYASHLKANATLILGRTYYIIVPAIRRKALDAELRHLQEPARSCMQFGAPADSSSILRSNLATRDLLHPAPLTSRAAAP